MPLDPNRWTLKTQEAVNAAIAAARANSNPEVTPDHLLVALLGQVERLASSIGVPTDAYLELASATLDNAASIGAPAALTGPVARGDWVTVRRHIEALPEEERPAYTALAAAAARLAGTEPPAGLLDP